MCVCVFVIFWYFCVFQTFVHRKCEQFMDRSSLKFKIRCPNKLPKMKINYPMSSGIEKQRTWWKLYEVANNFNKSIDINNASLFVKKHENHLTPSTAHLKQMADNEKFNSMQINFAANSSKSIQSNEENIFNPTKIPFKWITWIFVRTLTLIGIIISENVKLSRKQQNNTGNISEFLWLILNHNEMLLR